MLLHTAFVVLKLFCAFPAKSTKSGNEAYWRQY